MTCHSLGRWRLESSSVCVCHSGTWVAMGGPRGASGPWLCACVPICPGCSLFSPVPFLAPMVVGGSLVPLSWSCYKVSAVLIAGFAGQLPAVGSFPPVYLSATVYDSAWGWGFLGRGGRLHLVTRNGPEPPHLPRGGLSGSNQRAAAPGEVSESLRGSGLGLAGDDVNK